MPGSFLSGSMGSCIFSQAFRCWPSSLPAMRAWQRHRQTRHQLRCFARSGTTAYNRYSKWANGVPRLNPATGDAEEDT
jgi:hypothetical protein